MQASAPSIYADFDAGQATSGILPEFSGWSSPEDARDPVRCCIERPRVTIDIEQAYRRHGPMVYRRCQKLLRHDGRAEDAMHDVFVLLLRHHTKLENRGLSSLLYRMATNVCLNRIRSQRRKPEDADAELIWRIAAADPRLESRSATRNVLARILTPQGESTATIAVLHFVDGMTLQEVAEVVGMSVSGVRKRLAKLKQSILDLPEVEP